MTDKETMAIIKQMVADGQISQEVAEKYFPELKEKESEDEKIRKHLINYFKHKMDDTLEYWEGIAKEDVLAWLEKQGEKAKYHDICDKCVRQPTCQSDCFLQQGEQKSTDKVEQKFYEGDWIIFNGLILYIKEVVKGYYRTISIDGIPNSYDWDIDNVARLWTIQDAKAGDVLSYVTEEEDLWIMIYWSLYEPYDGFVHYHALLVKDDFTDKGTCRICIDDLKPATKEQRDLLFQKMKEAGYEWDAEKKVLRKIEQKPADKDERKGMNIVEEDMTPFQKKVFCIIDTTIEEEQGLKQVCDELLRLAHDEIMQKPAEWSEEDEKTIHLACEFIRHRSESNGSIGGINYSELINRLRSIIPQNRWKPTEKEMEAISIAVHDSHNRSYHTELYRLKLDLKKLKG